MAWLRIDDRFHSNPKVLDAGNEAAGLYARALSFCAANLTDGHVPATWARQAGREAAIKAIGAAGLWRPIKKGDAFETKDAEGELIPVLSPSDGYIVPGYLEFNPSKLEVEADRNRKSEAGKAGARKRWADGKREADAIAPAITLASSRRHSERHSTSHRSAIGTPMPPTRPDPTVIETRAVTGVRGGTARVENPVENPDAPDNDIPF